MHPVLFQVPIFGGVTIYTYGVMVALAFVVGIVWVSHESRRVGQDPARAVDCIFYVILSAIIGSRILHVAISEWDRFVKNPLIFFKIWEGGLVFYGGLIASAIVGIWYFKRHKLPTLLYLDIFAPGIALGHAIGRIGCFLVGCCYGRHAPVDAWYSVIFPTDPHCFAPTGVALYPTQLMESFGELIIFTALFFMRYVKRFDGQLMALYLIMYSVLRSVNEYFRGDYERGFLVEPWLSTSQFISLLIFAFGVAMYVVCMRRARKERV